MKRSDKFIPYGRQTIDDSDIDAVVAVLRSDFITQGPTIPAFEKALCETVSARHAVAVNSGTSALHLACGALDLGPGDWLWTSPITFVASANCGVYCGAQVDFVDIDPVTWNMDTAALERKLERAQREGRLPKVLVAVHFAGLPCDMAAIQALSSKFGFRVIEDASHALGAVYRGGAIGDCRHSDVTVFSFHPVKPITTGEGGAALTMDSELARRMRLLHTHGITRDSGRLDSGSADGGWYYEQVDLGYNYRMTDLQAALGVSQLRRLDQFVAARTRLAGRYDALLAELPLRLPARSGQATSAWHLYAVRIDVVDEGHTRRRVYDCMSEAGIGVNVHYIPVHLQPFYRRMGFKEGDFVHAEDYYRQALSLPLFPTLTDRDQERVVRTLAAALR